jgi:tRNA 2-thiouridine synthesizing protein A
MTRHTLDARHLLCPLPVIRTQNKMKNLNKGDVLVVSCTDPGAINDIPMWCRINGHTVIDTATTNNEISITIEVNNN